MFIVTFCKYILTPRILQLVHILFSGPDSSVGIATGYGLDGPEIESRWEARFSAPVQTGHGAHPASCTMDTGSFPGVKSARGVMVTPHLLLVPWSRKGRAIPLLPLWAVRPVQSLSACTGVHFSFFFFTLLPDDGPFRVETRRSNTVLIKWWVLM